MRISIAQPQFLKSLQMIERAVNDRSTLPILANVLLQLENNQLTLTATDLDVGIQCRFPLHEPGEQGAVTLPARKLTTIVRELPDDTIVFEAKRNHTVTLNCGPSSFRIPGLPAEDFPVLPPLDSTTGVSLPQGALKALITQTAYAMSTEESRFILNGALLTTQKQTLTMVATDGRRLALATAALSESAKQPVELVVPAKTIRELGRLLPEDEPEEVTIALLKDNQLMFQFGGIRVVTRLLEGKFPAYDKVIPAVSKSVLTCDRQALISAIRRASLMTSTTSQAVVFDVAKERLIVSKESPEMGSAREELPATYTGDALTIAFNPEFWLDALKVMEDEQVRIELSSSERPAAVRVGEGDGPRKGGFTYIVLPMKVT